MDIEGLELFLTTKIKSDNYNDYFDIQYDFLIEYRKSLIVQNKHAQQTNNEK